MAELYHLNTDTYGICDYLVKRKKYQTEEEWKQTSTSVRQSTTVYIGDLSFHTREEQIYELFSKVGQIKRIIMGINKYTKTPCGFCFVEFV